MPDSNDIPLDQLLKAHAERLSQYRRLIDSAIEKLKAVPDQGLTTDVFRLVWKRLQHGLTVMELLDKQPEAAFEKAVILRAMYDFHLQQLYLLTDVPKLATDFVDFAYVEQAEMINLINQGNTQFAQGIKAQQKFIIESQNRLADFQKIRTRFETKKKTLHKNWYMGKLMNIVSPKLLHEYNQITLQLNQVVHGSFIILNPGPSIADPTYMNDMLVITIRVIAGIANYLGVQFTPEEQVLIGYAAEPLLG